MLKSYTTLQPSDTFDMARTADELNGQGHGRLGRVCLLARIVYLPLRTYAYDDTHSEVSGNFH